jgi:MoaA/NifB/PqqE/SkfB family radical SAM enzyme
MNPFLVARAAKSALSRVELNFNRLVGRELVPVETTILNIETSSLCNLECVFCAYVKKSSPKVSMKDAFFQHCIEQALGLGFSQFELTPCTGDVFMDRHIWNKFQFLDDHRAVDDYRFFTNFTIPKLKDIDRLAKLRKLKNVTISIYGHDLASFLAITKSTEKVYQRLVANLKALLGQIDRLNFHLDIGIRTTKDAPRRPASELMELLERFRERGVRPRRAHVYNNWGGYVTQADVAGLAIDISGAEAVYKRGACAHLFTTYQIMATGVVNGCACRDVDATLQIGDMNVTPLRDILSPDNPVYMRLIEEQQRGDFRPVCKSCDYYKSIYHMRTNRRRDGSKFQSIEQFKDRLRVAGEDAGCAGAQPFGTAAGQVSVPAK